MSLIPPQELADLWYLRYGYDWVKANALPKELCEVTDLLKKTSWLDYHMGLDKEGYFEVLQLKKERHANRRKQSVGVTNT
jgi:hypothetical protein